MRKYEVERFSPDEVKALSADLSIGNEVIVETAGFEPLEVKLKRFEQNGMVAQFLRSDFTSSDLRELYLNPDFDITPEDDIEDVFEKLGQLHEYQKSVTEQIKKRNPKSNGEDVKAGTVEPEKKVESSEKPVEKPKNDE